MVRNPEDWFSQVAAHISYYIAGNHEYYTVDVHNWMKKLTSLGVKVLINENVPLPDKEDRSVCLAGVNDPMADEYMYVCMVDVL